MVSNFSPEEEAEAPQTGNVVGTNGELICFIRSNHALAVGLMKDALASESSLRAVVKPYSDVDLTKNHGRLRILILDTCSVSDWAVCLEKWQAEGGLTIGLVSSEQANNGLELQLLHLGASGILRSTDNLAHQLPRAVQAVASGHLWIRRDVLDLYVKRTRMALQNFSLPNKRLTARERQILSLIQASLSNRVIAKKLGVSERTIKFHVSNVLHKLNLSSRNELKSLNHVGGLLLLNTPQSAMTLAS